jgi:pSer/pThr/pTyr-binding forkhead associated (FHA) protein
MKVQLVVVRGKPEGKVIPLGGPNFKIGRGETCHLRPSSELVSREHAEFTISGDVISVRDMGSRNGTLVNGKALTSEAVDLKDRDLVQVGPLTFAVSIQGVAAAVAKPSALAAASGKASPDDVSTDDIDSWLIGEGGAGAEQPTAVYGGDTITISAFKDASAAPKATAPKEAAPAPKEAAAAAKPPLSASDDEYERLPENEVEAEEGYLGEDEDEVEEGGEEESEDGSQVVVEEEFIDESNPFYAAKKAQKLATNAGPAKPSFKDTSDAASDILRRLMERRRADRG